ncbi:MAG: SpaA isopeptide-forming pilin-related protein, partial [Lachnospiraceae bacterium]|nr:SpaA isopeptide-forming pilin-related protein [Lachnospiraceae bacterium]
MKNLKRSTKIQMFKAAACILVAAVLVINTVFLYANNDGEDTSGDSSSEQTEMSTPEPTEMSTPEPTEEPTVAPTDAPTEQPQANIPQSDPAPSSPAENPDVTDPPAPIETEETGTTVPDTTEVPAPDATATPTDESGNTPTEAPSVEPSVSPSVEPSVTPAPTEPPKAETINDLSIAEGLPAGISGISVKFSEGVPKTYTLHVESGSEDTFSAYIASMKKSGYDVIGSEAFDIHIEDNGEMAALPENVSAEVTVNFSAPIFKGKVSDSTVYKVLHGIEGEVEALDAEGRADASGLSGITFTTASFSPFIVTATVMDNSQYNRTSELGNGQIDITSEIDLTEIVSSINTNVKVNNEPLSDKEYNIDTIFELNLNYVFDESKLQTIQAALANSTQEYVTFYYQMPPEAAATMDNRMSGELVAAQGNAGTYEIQKDGKVLFNVTSDFLRKNSDISGTFAYYFELGEKAEITDDKVELRFPGDPNPTVIHVKKAAANGWKDAFYDKEKDEISTTITLRNGDRDAKSVAVIDMPESNLEIEKDTIKVSIKVGNETTELSDPEITWKDGNFTIDLGDLAPHAEVVVTYTATIKDKTLDEDGNGVIDGLNNKFKWEIDGENGGSKDAWVQVYKETSGSKRGSVEGQKIKWTVNLNNGDIKSNVSGKKYIDTMTSKPNNQVYVHDTLKVSDQSGTDVTDQCTIVWLDEEGKFEVTLPENAGEQSYKIEYYTEPKTSLGIGDSVSVTNVGDFDGNTIPGEDKTIERNSELGLTKTHDGVNLEDLTTIWTAVITPDVDGITDPVFYDYIGTQWTNGEFLEWNGSVFQEDPTVTYNGATLTAGKDYDVTYEALRGAEGHGNNHMIISFKGKYTSPITITYTTIDNGVIPETETWGGKTIDNTCHVDNKWVWDKVQYQKQSESGSDARGIFKKPGTLQYNEADKCYYVDWKVWANSTLDTWGSKGVADLGESEPVVIVDELPDGLKVVENSVKIEAWDDDLGWSARYTTDSPEVDIQFENDGRKLIITIQSVKQRQILVTYKTQITKYAETLTNVVTYRQDGKELGRAEGEVIATGDLLKKEGTKVTIEKNDLIEYTIKVNEKGLDYLPGDTLILEDTIPSNVELVNGSISFTDLSGALLPEGTASYLYNTTTRVLQVEVPDSQPVLVKYRVNPILDGLTGVGTTYSIDVSNTVVLSGHEDIKGESKQNYTIQTSNATISGKKDEIYIYKVDAQDTGKGLNGAVYHLYKMMTETGEFMPVLGSSTETASVDGKEGYLSYKELSLNTVYYYVEHEAPDGYVLDNTKHYFIIKDVTNGEENYKNAVAKFEEKHPEESLNTLSGGNTISPTNVRKPTADIVAAKRVENGQIASYAGQFQFTLTETNEDGTPISDGRTETVSNDENGYVKFAEIEYQNAGTYWYTITENSGSVPGIAYSAESYRVKVDVAKNSFTGFTTKVTYYSKDAETGELEQAEKAEFVNTYSAEAELKVQKTYDGEFPEDGFSFILEPVNGAPMPENYTDVTVTDGTVASFGKIEYTTNGTYEYKISEVIPTGATETVEGIRKDGIVYDSTIYDVKVVVENGIVTVSYKKTGDTDYSVTENATFGFTNAYSAEGEVVLKAGKALEGRALTDGQFEFELYES